MLQAVHTDRTGRVYVSADYGATGFNGASAVPVQGIALPVDAALVPLSREAQGFDRSGRARPLGKARWALAATLPPGYTRSLHPAFIPTDEALEPLAYAALGADRDGQLVVAALVTDPGAIGSDQTPTPPARIAAALSARSGNTLLRQLARCAREYGCGGAGAIFTGQGDGSLPLGGPGADLVARHGLERARPTDPAAFRPTAAEIAEIGAAHLRAGGGAVSFGRACDGEPLAQERFVEDAIARIRAITTAGTIHLETDGLRPQALRRLLAAGLGAVTVRLEEGSLAVRRDTLRAAADAGAALAVALPVFPGRTDRAGAVESLLELLASLPGGTLVVRDRPGDPHHLKDDTPPGEPLGVAAALDRIRHELPRWRIAAFARPLIAAA